MALILLPCLVLLCALYILIDHILIRPFLKSIWYCNNAFQQDLISEKRYNSIACFIEVVNSIWWYLLLPVAIIYIFTRVDAMGIDSFSYPEHYEWFVTKNIWLFDTLLPLGFVAIPAFFILFKIGLVLMARKYPSY